MVLESNKLYYAIGILLISRHSSQARFGTCVIVQYHNKLQFVLWESCKHVCFWRCCVPVMSFDLMASDTLTLVVRYMIFKFHMMGFYDFLSLLLGRFTGSKSLYTDSPRLLSCLSPGDWLCINLWLFTLTVRKSNLLTHMFLCLSNHITSLNNKILVHFLSTKL